jgi:hypothetical protein
MKTKNVCFGITSGFISEKILEPQNAGRIFLQDLTVKNKFFPGFAVANTCEINPARSTFRGFESR